MNTTTQQIPTGYKQTEVGIIPEDWELVSYDQAFNFLKTASYSRAQLGTNGQIRYVHYGDIHMKWNFFVDLKQDLPTINEDKASGYSLIENGDIVMADASEDYAGIGKSVEVVNKDNIHAISGLHTFLLRDKGDYFVSGFRGYIHSNKYVKSSMDRLATGLKVYGVSKTNLKLVQIPRPPLPEQTAIANALSDTDELITKLEKLIGKKKAIKQGAMQELLTGKRHLPGFGGEWEEKKLGELIIFSNGKPYEPNFVNKGKYKVITLDSIDINGKLKTEHRRTNLYDGSLKKNDIVIVLSDIAHARLLGLCDLIPEDNEYVLNQRMGRIRPINNDEPKYLRLQINSHQDHFRMRGQGTSQRHIYKRDIDELVIPMPPERSEQSAIANILSDMDSEIDYLEKELVKYQQVKIGMMQQLLTGKIRIYGSN
jgi:type I restriction enzyme, S subunit